MLFRSAYTIQCIHVKPLLAKFADQLSHRDFLGALMNLGIDRSTIGDIKVGNKEGYIYCLDSISEFICTNLDKIKHTNVKCQVVTEAAKLPEELPEEMEILVSSLRIDGCLAKIYHKSRSEIIELFRSGKVYVNGRLCENNAKILKNEEVVNLRGYGKFIFAGIKYETKKGKICAEIKIFK